MASPILLYFHGILHILFAIRSLGPNVVAKIEKTFVVNQFCAASFFPMDILSRTLRSYIFRRRLAKTCPCGIRISWSKLRGNKGPQCFLHALPLELWRQSPLHEHLSLSAFRTELLAHHAFYGNHQQEVLDIAFNQGQAHVLAVFRLFAKSWNQGGYSHLATYQFYRCMRFGWRATMDYLRNWKTVHLPQQSYVAPLLKDLYSLASPVIREELRQPAYAPILRAFAAEQLLVPLRSPWDARRTLVSLCKMYRAGFAQTVTRYQWRLLGFWVTVRAKIAHWRRAHTFKPLPTFAPNTEPLDLLVQRNPCRVPQAGKEFLRALATSDVPLMSMDKDMKDWIQTLKSPAVYGQIVELYRRTEAWLELADLFIVMPQRDMTPALLTRILAAFEAAPSQYSKYYKGPLRHYLMATDFAAGSKATCAMVSAFHPLCRQPQTFHWLLHTANVRRYIRDPAVSQTIVDLYMNRGMCVRLQHTHWRDYAMEALWETPAVQQMYVGIRKEATEVLRRFMGCALQVHRQKKRRMATVLETAAPHVSIWTFLQVRWRFLHRPSDCPVCMETRILLPLHGEKRHGVCRGCMPRVAATGRCPLCRTALRTHTFSDVSSISYTSDHNQEYYEDPDYDDDQWYHYN